MEQDRTALATVQAQADQLGATGRCRTLPARNAQQVAAEANLQAARPMRRGRGRIWRTGAHNRPGWPGRSTRVFFRIGEAAAVGNPVPAILPEGPLEAWFFVPEPEGVLRWPGGAATVTRDGLHGHACRGSTASELADHAGAGSV
ncbi:hypothetical protein [Devosia ginsengisoli]|uniref:Uncharacterized protein n=1 Tax=Devosia ginsengisoli TaxID=400770 RepID=A0A5B8LM14_9HYPH|nr:hypothetical protein [Devosia ginsengisoli]QDZ09287.1 hypothetical protein FPZ08_00025 [Devosia ginsengisoli]